MEVIVQDPGRYHVSLDTVWEFEGTIARDTDVEFIRSGEASLSRIPNIFWRQLFRLEALVPFRAPSGRARSSRQLFAVLMGPNLRKTLPHFLGSSRKAAYIFDAWPHNHERFRLFADACRIQDLFVSSSQGAAQLSRSVRGTRCHWIPEAIDPLDYHLAFSPERTIDVLQLGRRYNSYHDMIVEKLAEAQKTYLYEKTSGRVIFPGRPEYIEGLARSKISICVPLSLSNPERAGGIETMTVRYLQSMLSKCLIVGQAPAEMVQVFGYNPVIEIDFTDPAKQILDVLKNLGDYRELIERNFACVLEKHTWRQRWMAIRAILEKAEPA